MFIILAACGENNSSNTIVNITDEEYRKYFIDHVNTDEPMIDERIDAINEINLITSKSNENKNYNKLLVDYEKFYPSDILLNNDLLIIGGGIDGENSYRTELLQNYTDEPLHYYDSFKEIIEKFNNLSGTELCINLINHKYEIDYSASLSANSAINYFRDIFPNKKNEIIEEIKSNGFGPEREARKINEELERLDILHHKALVKALYNYATLAKYQYLNWIYSKNYYTVLPDDYWGDPNFPSRAQIKQNEFEKRLKNNQLSNEDNQMIRGFCEANHQIQFRLKESDLLPANLELIDANELIEELNNLGESEFIQKRKGEILIRGAISDVKSTSKVHAIFESKKVNFDNKIICNIETNITSTFSKLKSKKWNDLILVSGNLLELDEEENIIIEACNIEREY
tara:strand:+ start:3390 stop:4589 length:1200 start_codon:yes stop_codon:yes gene_type:complete